jgi:hypothetical protein
MTDAPASFQLRRCLAYAVYAQTTIDVASALRGVL